MDNDGDEQKSNDPAMGDEMGRNMYSHTMQAPLDDYKDFS